MRRYFSFRSIAVLCLVWHSYTFLSAQPFGFSRTYFLEERSTFFHAVRQLENQLIVLGQLGGDSLGNNGVFVASLDTFGEIVKVSIFQDPLGLNSLNLSTAGCEAITLSPDGGILFSGATRFGKNLFVIKVDGNLDLQFFQEFDCDFKFRYVDFAMTHLDAFYMCGLVQTQNLDFDIFIQKTDFTGRQIWEKTFGSLDLNENGSSAISEGNEILIMASENYDPDHFEYNDDITWNHTLRIDTSGELVTKWKGLPNEEGGSPEGFLKFNSNYYYITHPSNQISINTIHFAPQIVCRDESFNLKWRRDYGELYFLNWFSDLEIGPDSFLYVAGYIPEEVTWGRVCKIDPENGNLIWDARDTAFYLDGWGSRNRMEGLTVLPSGSVIAVGYTMDYSFHENGLLYKVTKDGCIDTLCMSVSIDDLLRHPDDRVKVFPNPAVEAIIVDIGEEEDLTFALYTIQGQLVYQEKLETSETQVAIEKYLFVDGVYIWVVKNKLGHMIESGKLIIGVD